MSTVAIASRQNPRTKEVVKLRKRAHRDRAALLLVEGYREIHRAVENNYRVRELFFCPGLFMGPNEPALMDRCAAAGADLFECAEDVFRKMAYRDRPEGLLAVVPWIRRELSEISLSEPGLVVIAETIEKPGNLGTILRAADAAGADAVLVCDPRTDVGNPNVVRASIGTLFALPVVETSTADAARWLQEQRVQIVAATPGADTDYTEADLRQPTAIVVGAEQYGLSERWLSEEHCLVRIPMRGQADSLNVASAATVLLFEAVRQRGVAGDEGKGRETRDE